MLWYFKLLLRYSPQGCLPPAPLRLFLGEEVNDTSASIVVAQLLFLEAEDPEKDIHQYMLGRNIDFRRLSLSAACWLVNHDFRVGQGETLALCSSRPQEGTHTLCH